MFGRKQMQKINNIIFSLSLGAKGYKNYGNFSTTGEKNFIMLINKDLELCLDIGANVGKYSKLILNNSNANLLSFEPLKEAYIELHNLEKKYPDRIKTFNIALGDSNCEMDIKKQDDKSETATFIEETEMLSFFDIKKQTTETTKVEKLDYFLSKNKSLIYKEIDLIKIDTEGFELEVLKGAKDTIVNCKPKYIQFEYNWHQLFKNHTIYNFSLPFGKNLLSVDPSRPETNIYHLSNFVYIRKDISKKYK